MDGQIILLIVGMAVVSYLPRALPLLMFNKIEFPDWLIKWLGFIPAAVLAALLAPDLFLIDGHFNLSVTNTYLLAALPTLLIALVTKSMIWALLGGMGSFALLQLFL
ncbi:MAG: AzlD domain-containing protein [Clostridia bacterium]|jgi:branched-subunit amino acid transport protein|nr:AzlD domain-containing protein [Clostridia bacterium]